MREIMEKLCAGRKITNGSTAASYRRLGRGARRGERGKRDRAAPKRRKRARKRQNGRRTRPSLGLARLGKKGNGEKGAERRESSVLRASRPNPALPSHHANCTTVG